MNIKNNTFKPSWLLNYEKTIGYVPNSELSISSENQLKGANVNVNVSKGSKPNWLVKLENSIL